jgi:hypothetical protein
VPADLLGNWKTHGARYSGHRPVRRRILHHTEVGQAHRATDRHIFSGKGGSYAGKITDPDAKKTYDDLMTVSGNIVKMKGCVMKVFSSRRPGLASDIAASLGPRDVPVEQALSTTALKWQWEPRMAERLNALRTAAMTAFLALGDSARCVRARSA